MKKYPVINQLDLDGLRALLKDINKAMSLYPPSHIEQANLSTQRDCVSKRIAEKESKLRKANDERKRN